MSCEKKGASAPEDCLPGCSVVYLYNSIFGCMHQARSWPTARPNTASPSALTSISDSASKLRNAIAAALARPDFGSLTILFSSGGGSTATSLSLFNFINQLTVPVHMHSMGHIGSSAAPLFAAGTKRTCSPLVRFFFHEYHLTFDGEQPLTRVEEAVDALKSDIRFARHIMGSRYHGFALQRPSR